MAKAILWIVLVSCYFALLASGQFMTYPPEVDALKAIRRKLNDPLKNLKNWTRGDPCARNWTGVICTQTLDDGYVHVQELYSARLGSLTAIETTGVNYNVIYNIVIEACTSSKSEDMIMLMSTWDDLRMLNLNLTGKLAPELGLLSNLTFLNFMWNNITGGIPKEISNLKYLKYLLLSGNKLSEPLADQLGYLPSLLNFQIDWNQISGSLPKSFVNLISCRHFHMNNNSISGQIPPELSSMPQLQHFLLDNNNLSGYLPPEFSHLPNLKILQLDNNNFGGTQIPASYGNISTLVKISLRNCNLQGAIPDFSNIKPFRYLDLSHNQLTGGIPTNKLSNITTTIDLSYNLLNGSIPSNFSTLPNLQRLSLENNSLSGDVPSNVWQNENFTATDGLILDFRYNSLTNISGSIDPPANVTIRLDGNPVCNSANQLNISQFCGSTIGDNDVVNGNSSNSNNDICKCPSGDFEQVPDAPVDCFCAAPLGVLLRLRSPSFIDFRPYKSTYRWYITSNLNLDLYQLLVPQFIWEIGPRLRLDLKFFPQYNISNSNISTFNHSEVSRIMDSIATFTINSSEIFGPFELMGFEQGIYSIEVNIVESTKSGISTGAIIGIIFGALFFGVAISVATVFLWYKTRKSGHAVSKKESTQKVPIRTESVKEFSFTELEAATNGFKDASQVGQGGYGKVYRGILANGTVVAIKRARQGSLQGQIEFITEIEMLSRLHHRNLVSLVGYCSEQGEQMLVYEFMPNGSVHDLLSDRYRHTLSFSMRMRIALGSAKGILYLHTEADPPIIHRDIKANNILLDFKFTPKVSDFGISRLAPIPDAEGASAHVSTVVKGTPGYLDPEYFLTHKLTEKSDVYSLGIVFLELLTGMLPISHGKNIVREVQGACQSGLMFSIIDRSMGSYSSECAKKFMALALKCCQDDPKERPTMLEVVRELENISSLLSESDMIPTESDPSVSESVREGGSSPRYSERNSHPQISTEIVGSELISGVMPTIRPR